jgi:hypothetical protein
MRHNNLPAQRVRLIGREHDLRLASEALLTNAGRLLTFTGAGGCGKTRLALELARLVSGHLPMASPSSSSLRSRNRVRCRKR